MKASIFKSFVPQHLQLALELLYLQPVSPLYSPTLATRHAAAAIRRAQLSEQRCVRVQGCLHTAFRHLELLIEVHGSNLVIRGIDVIPGFGKLAAHG